MQDSGDDSDKKIKRKPGEASSHSGSDDLEFDPADGDSLLDTDANLAADAANFAQEMRDLVQFETTLPTTLLLVPIHTAPVYPGMMAPLVLTKSKLIDTVEHALANRGLLGLVLDKGVNGDANTNNFHSVPSVAASERSATPSTESSLAGLHRVGTVVRIVRKLNNSDGGMTVLVQSVKRFEIKKIVREEPYVVAQVEYKNDILEKSIELDALVRSVIADVKKLSETNPFFTEELKLAMVNAPNVGLLADLVAFALALPKADAQEFLETFDVRGRFEKLLYHLKREQEVAEVQKKINEDVSTKIQRAQREYFLKEQLRSIRRELGSDEEGSRSIDKLRARIEATALTEEARRAALDELKKLEGTPDASPENNIIRNYLDFLLSLPWGKTSVDNLDIHVARKTLDEDHYGIQKIKDRILEHLAVKKLNPNAKGSVLCLVGPPGVGKTSLGKSIARAMGRQFFRFSLGGMRDEAEIKGHRRTYIGAMPGKLLGAMKRVGTQNPIILLDEIDKLGSSYQGDPASALLEVLDPEQNVGFLDHYLDLPFDLSNVMFVVTANSTSTIPAPLLDRMEVIELTGYTLEEKVEIAKAHVIPKELERHGLTAVQLKIPDQTLKTIMFDYAREPGMRTLQQQIAAICRKVAAQVVAKGSLEGGSTRKTAKFQTIKVLPKMLYDYLGPEKFHNEWARRTQTPGVVTGLAWTAMGGQILFIEATGVPKRPLGSAAGVTTHQLLKKQPAAVAPKEKDDDPASGAAYGALKLTGQLGEVMVESAQIAYSYVKKMTIKDAKAAVFFRDFDIHLHIPAGAIPKDGPSAGVTMATALYSLVTNRRVRPGLAMTGELSLVGKVLPVGGIKEKVLAAKRVGIKTIVLPALNRKDVKEIEPKAIEDLELLYAESIDDVFKYAFR